ncbi:MAG TPA: phytoene/squalene synthase family protein [Pyrinomonadaceae bacterium]
MLEELEKAYKYCEKITKVHAKSFYFAARFLPAEKQKAVYPIYAFCRHIDDEIDEIGAGNETDAIAAVENWRAALEEVYFNAKRQRNGEAKQQIERQIKADENGLENQFQKSKSDERNLVFTAWEDLLKKYKIPRNLPLELMRGVLQDTRVKRYETFDDLYVYCYRVASTVGLMSSEILGYSDAAALEYAEAMGIAMQLTNILRDVKEDAAMNRIYLPQEDLSRFDVSEKQIFANEFGENFIRMMKFQVERARDYYARGEKGIRLLEKDSRFTVLLASRIYSKILDEIEKQNYNVFKRRAHTSKRQKMLAIPLIWLSAKKI